ncbi:hypothetical protein LSAT2_024807 [Lamellibrachia satsuma]|nr:hypothetical protein LSAT2_024807 [Lamellibrachia satsuma]
MTGFVCHCASGYKGMTCEEVIETCTADTCVNNGTCTNSTVGINCTCPSGYGGIHCETKIQHCKDVTCNNGSTCMNDDDTGYKCVCAAGFTGVLCETELMFCQREMPCENGGTCVDLPKDNYVCVCPRCGCSTEKPFDNCTIVFSTCFIMAIRRSCAKSALVLSHIADLQRSAVVVNSMISLRRFRWPSGLPGFCSAIITPCAYFQREMFLEILLNMSATSLENSACAYFKSSLGVEFRMPCCC